jgi:hypothetical protein
LLRPGHGVPAGVGLLDDIFGIGQGAKQPVSEIEQLTPLAHDRAQVRAGLLVSGPLAFGLLVSGLLVSGSLVSGPGSGAHGAALPWSHLVFVVSAFTSSTRQHTAM